MGYIHSACAEIAADERYKKLPKSAKTNFLAAAKAVKQLYEEAQPKLSEDIPEKLSFDINEVNAAFQAAEAAVAAAKTMMA